MLSGEAIRRRSLWRPLLLFALALGLAACAKQDDSPALSQAEVGVVTLQSERLPIASELPGRTRAYLTADVRPRIGGILRKRLFTEGATVHEGDVLYEIDPAPYQAAYDSARGTLAQAEAAVLSARPKAERYRKLAELDAVSQQDRDDALASLKQDQAAVVVAKASLESARIDLGYTQVRAPISGRIGTSTYTPGALVTADQTTALATINQLDPIYVDVTQSSAQLLSLRRRMKEGALKSAGGGVPVSLILEDGSRYAHEGTLAVVASEVDEATGTVKLRAVVPNPDHELLPGMYVKASLSMVIDEQAVLAPQRAVSRNGKGEATVLVVDDAGQVQSRVVQTGPAIGSRWVITAGVAAGERVVVQGAQKVRAGDTVRAVEIEQGADASDRSEARPAAPSGTPGLPVPASAQAG
ncbi:efflux RND transporter periplasmic adaptor subunit [Castellaniella sp.]|uniref:efflux RND transporter periplasmic adaptor subunit n=1 Tax=Castellaniella sp. TaxID=1955812 RepID=UPI002AFF8D8B|nr:efflux RND transporter periplasmic adaptor subunit [Castellaniella sp.]